MRGTCSEPLSNRCLLIHRTEFRGPTRPPGFGEHTREVLEAAGVPESEIAHLAESGAVVLGEPFTL